MLCNYEMGRKAEKKHLYCNHIESREKTLIPCCALAAPRFLLRTLSLRERFELSGYLWVIQ